jgi:homoserine kinase
LRSVVVRAPATSANLGPGFDCLGLALDLWNEVEATPGRLVADDATNLILRAARAVYDAAGAPYPGFELRCTNRVILGRGLGSSAAAIASGVLFANEALGRPLDEPALLKLASGLEGHPDNVVPALLGGVRVATCAQDGRVLQTRVPVAMRLDAVCFVPEMAIPTPHARGLLPSSVTMADAVFNVARSSLLVAALASGEPELLAEATRDRLHQQYRLPLFPAGATLLEAAMRAGALGAFMSGAGPTVLALCSTGHEAVDRIQAAFESAAHDEDVPGFVLRLGLSERGAHVAA